MEILKNDIIPTIATPDISIYPNYEVFKITAPTGFGITWAQEHIKTLIPHLSKPIDTHHDFTFDIHKKLEIKASRAVTLNSNKPLYEKGLLKNSNDDFLMNFQQLKPSYCDVFLWMGVWLDTTCYWVMSSHEVATLKGTTKQHAGENFEMQYHIKLRNISLLDKYIVPQNDLLNGIRSAYDRQPIKKHLQKSLLDFCK